MARSRPRPRWNLRWRPTDTPTDHGRLGPDLQGPAARLPEATHIPRGLR